MKYRSQKGVTLFELLIVMAVAAILATIGVPSLVDFVKNNRLTSASMQLVGDLNLARSEAIKRNSRILICSGTAACVNNSDWAANGWIVCYDTNRDNICDAAPGDGSDPNPFLVRAPVKAQGIIFAGPAVPIVFNSIGTQGVVGAAIPLPLVLSGNWVGTKVKNVTVSQTGAITSY